MDEWLGKAQNDLGLLLTEYTELSSHIVPGDVADMFHYDLVDFVNFRLETVDSCKLLIDSDKVADSLALNRSLMENYLIFILMCRGNKYIRLGNFKGVKGTMDEILEQERQKVGKDSLLSVEPYPDLRRHLLYIFEGLRPKGKPDAQPVPYHHFLYKEFRPEEFRLDSEDYFTYYDEPDDVKEVQKKARKQQSDMYSRYLSYDAIVKSLIVNDIVDDRAALRINAHYTFLGTFLHPTADAFRNLHERNNHHDFVTRIGLEQPLSKVSKLLAYTYTIHNAIGILNELAAKLDDAPSEYFTESGTGSIKALIERLEAEYSFFWYVFNEPSKYDKFNYAIHHVDDDELSSVGGYENIDSTQVTFNQYIYGNFESTFGGWSNQRVGSYSAPTPTKR